MHGVSLPAVGWRHHGDGVGVPLVEAHREQREVVVLRVREVVIVGIAKRWGDGLMSTVGRGGGGHGRVLRAVEVITMEGYSGQWW